MSRADLIRCRARLGESALEEMAALFGYARSSETKRSRQAQVPPPPSSELPSPLPKKPASLSSTGLKLDAPFFRVVKHELLNQDPAPGEKPHWFNDAEPLSKEEIRGSGTQEPLSPLSPWSALWPFLRTALGARQSGKRLDIERIVHRIAQGKTLRRLPRKKRPGWAGSAQVILDFDPSLHPFWEDFYQLIHQVKRLRGLAGLEVLKLRGGPEGLCEDFVQKYGPEFPYRLPSQGTPVLVLSDLGCLDKSPERQRRVVVFCATPAKRRHPAGRLDALSPPVVAAGGGTLLLSGLLGSGGALSSKALIEGSAYAICGSNEGEGRRR